MTSARREIRRSILAAAGASPNEAPNLPIEVELEMGRIVISENVSLDGVAQEPTGEEGFKQLAHLVYEVV